MAKLSLKLNDNLMPYFQKDDQTPLGALDDVDLFYKMYYLIDTYHDVTRFTHNMVDTSTSTAYGGSQTKLGPVPTINDNCISWMWNTFNDRQDKIHSVSMNKPFFKYLQNGLTAIDEDVSVAGNIEQTTGGIIKPFKSLQEMFGEYNVDIDSTSIGKIFTQCKEDGHLALYIYSILPIYDAKTIFPYNNTHMGYYIDSASSSNKLKNTPNICNSTNFVDLPGKKKETKYKLDNLFHPINDTANMILNKSFSFLAVGDLLFLNKMHEANSTMKVDAVLSSGMFHGDLSIDSNGFINSLDKPSAAAAAIMIKNKSIDLLKCSITAINIFWQMLLSYIYMYLKQSIHVKPDGDLVFTSADEHKKWSHLKDIESKQAIWILRHWVFTYVDITGKTPTLDDGKTIFSGRFHTNLNEPGYDIQKWFMTNQEPNAPSNVIDGSFYAHGGTNLGDDATFKKEFVVSQAKVIGLVDLGLETQANASPYPHIDNLAHGINTKATRGSDDPDNNQASPVIEHMVNKFKYLIVNGKVHNRVIITIGEIMKFSGDMSQKLSCLVSNTIFEKLDSNFKSYVTCEDRILVAGCIADQIPIIFGLTKKMKDLLNAPDKPGTQTLGVYLPGKKNIYGSFNLYHSKITKYMSIIKTCIDSRRITQSNCMKKYIDNKLNNAIFVLLNFIKHACIMYKHLFFNKTDDKHYADWSPDIEFYKYPFDISKLPTYNNILEQGITGIPGYDNLNKIINYFCELVNFTPNKCSIAAEDYLLNYDATENPQILTSYISESKFKETMSFRLLWLFVFVMDEQIDNMKHFNMSGLFNFIKPYKIDGLVETWLPYFPLLESAYHLTTSGLNKRQTYQKFFEFNEKFFSDSVVSAGDVAPFVDQTNLAAFGIQIARRYHYYLYILIKHYYDQVRNYLTTIGQNFAHVIDPAQNKICLFTENTAQPGNLYFDTLIPNYESKVNTNPDLTAAYTIQLIKHHEDPLTTAVNPPIFMPNINEKIKKNISLNAGSIEYQNKVENLHDGYFKGSLCSEYLIDIPGLKEGTLAPGQIDQYSRNAKIYVMIYTAFELICKIYKTKTEFEQINQPDPLPPVGDPHPQYIVSQDNDAKSELSFSTMVLNFINDLYDYSSIPALDFPLLLNAIGQSNAIINSLNPGAPFDMIDPATTYPILKNATNYVSHGMPGAAATIESSIVNIAINILTDGYSPNHRLSDPADPLNPHVYEDFKGEVDGFNTTAQLRLPAINAEIDQLTTNFETGPEPDQTVINFLIKLIEAIIHFYETIAHDPNSKCHCNFLYHLNIAKKQYMKFNLLKTNTITGKDHIIGLFNDEMNRLKGPPLTIAFTSAQIMTNLEYFVNYEELIRNTVDYFNSDPADAVATNAFQLIIGIPLATGATNLDIFKATFPAGVALPPASGGIPAGNMLNFIANIIDQVVIDFPINLGASAANKNKNKKGQKACLSGLIRIAMTPKSIQKMINIDPPRHDILGNYNVSLQETRDQLVFTRDSFDNVDDGTLLARLFANMNIVIDLSKRKKFLYAVLYSTFYKCNPNEYFELFPVVMPNADHTTMNTYINTKSVDMNTFSLGILEVIQWGNRRPTPNLPQVEPVSIELISHSVACVFKSCIDPTYAEDPANIDVNLQQIIAKYIEVKRNVLNLKKKIETFKINTEIPCFVHDIRIPMLGINPAFITNATKNYKKNIFLDIHAELALYDETAVKKLSSIYDETIQELNQLKVSQDVPFNYPVVIPTEDEIKDIIESIKNYYLMLHDIEHNGIESIPGYNTIINGTFTNIEDAVNINLFSMHAIEIFTQLSSFDGDITNLDIINKYYTASESPPAPRNIVMDDVIERKNLFKSLFINVDHEYRIFDVKFCEDQTIVGGLTESVGFPCQDYYKKPKDVYADLYINIPALSLIPKLNREKTYNKPQLTLWSIPKRFTTDVKAKDLNQNIFDIEKNIINNDTRAINNAYILNCHDIDGHILDDTIRKFYIKFIEINYNFIQRYIDYLKGFCHYITNFLESISSIYVEDDKKKNIVKNLQNTIEAQFMNYYKENLEHMKDKFIVCQDLHLNNCIPIDYFDRIVSMAPWYFKNKTISKDSAAIFENYMIMYEKIKASPTQQTPFLSFNTICDNQAPNTNVSNSYNSFPLYPLLSDASKLIGIIPVMQKLDGQPGNKKFTVYGTSKGSDERQLFDVWAEALERIHETIKNFAMYCTDLYKYGLHNDLYKYLQQDNFLLYIYGVVSIVGIDTKMKMLKIIHEKIKEYYNVPPLDVYLQDEENVCLVGLFTSEPTIFLVDPFMIDPLTKNPFIKLQIPDSLDPASYTIFIEDVKGLYYINDEDTKKTFIEIKEFINTLLELIQTFNLY